MDVSQLTAEQRKELEEKIKSMSPEQLAALQKQQCIFCQIVQGKIPAKKIYEDERTIVILDINPAAKGHLLLVPKEHYAIMPQVKQTDLDHFFVLSKLLSQVLLRTLRVTGTTIFVANGMAAGQRSAHFLIHVIARKEGDGLLAAREKLLEKTMIENVRTALATAVAKAFETGAKGQRKGNDVHIVDIGAVRERVSPFNDNSVDHSPVDASFREIDAEEVARALGKGVVKKKLAVKKSDKASSVGNKKKGFGTIPSTTSSKEREVEDESEEGVEDPMPLQKKQTSKQDVSLDDIANLFK